MKEHIPKKHLNFEEPIKTDKVFDNTFNRIYGERKPEPVFTETSLIGTGYNPADNLPKIGRKTLAQEREVSFNNQPQITTQADSYFFWNNLLNFYRSC
mgnify:CR=1 FL=1